MPENDPQTLGSARQAASDKLLQRLAKLIAESLPVLDASRQLDFGDSFAAITTEIGETILPRTLVFQNDRNEKLGLDVASGRILSISLLELKANVNIDPSLIGHAFFDTSDPLCRDLYEAITTFSFGIKTLFVRTVIRSESHSFSNIGITLLGLHHAQKGADTVPDAVIDDQRYLAFIKQIQTVASAIVCTNRRSIVKSWGDEDERARLELLAGEELEQNENPQPIPQNTPAQIAIWGENTDSGQAVSCASLQLQMVFAIAPSETVPFLVRCWEELLGGAHD